MQIDEVTMSELAERMLADYDSANPGSIFAEGFRLNVPDAWRLQAKVAKLRERRGERVIGYKVGCIDESCQKLNGLTHPAYGRLWDSELYSDGAVLNKSRYANPSMEAEFGITLSAPIVPGKTNIDDLIPAIQSIHPVIEIHNLVMRGEAPNGHELLANNALNAGVVMGAPFTDMLSVQETDLNLIYDDSIVDSWDSLSWPVDILRAIAWLTKKLDAQGIGLKKGDLILTGAWGLPIPMHERSKVTVTSSAFGNVSAVFKL